MMKVNQVWATVTVKVKFYCPATSDGEELEEYAVDAICEKDFEVVDVDVNNVQSEEYWDEEAAMERARERR